MLKVYNLCKIYKTYAWTAIVNRLQLLYYGKFFAVISNLVSSLKIKPLWLGGLRSI